VIGAPTFQNWHDRWLFNDGFRVVHHIGKQGAETRAITRISGLVENPDDLDHGAF
jgi:hypothetical protein